MSSDRVFRSFDDNVLELLFQSILENRRAHFENPQDESFARRAAADLQGFIEGLSGWIVEALAGSVPTANYHALSASEKRKLVMRHLSGPLMQPGSRQEMQHALLALNEGQVADLVKPDPRPNGLRGEEPFDAMRCRLDAICRVHWRHGQGILVGEAQREIANVIGRDVSTIQSWTKRCEKHFGRTRVEDELEASLLAGKFTPQEFVMHLSSQFGPYLSISEFDEAASKMRSVEAARRRMERLTPEVLQKQYQRSMRNNSAEPQ